jgi:hypothetical protein
MVKQILLTGTEESIEAIVAMVKRFNTDKFIESFSHYPTVSQQIEVQQITTEEIVRRVEVMVNGYHSAKAK